MDIVPSRNDSCGIVEDVLEEKVKRYLDLARLFFQKSQIDSSWKAYMAALKLNPSIAFIIEAEFVNVTIPYFNNLIRKGRFKSFLKKSDAVLQYYDDKYPMLFELGRLLAKVGYYEEACGFMQKCLKKNAMFVAAEDCLNAYKSVLVDRWHFRMLNDRTRNLSYRRAICEIIKPNDVVLDLGCGTGLLSMYAAETGAKVVACDSSKTMFNIATSVINDNGFGRSVSVLNSDSGALEPARFTAIITEIFDAGIFGEQCLDSIIDAQKRLNRTGRIVPGGVSLYMCGIQSETLAKRYRLVRSEGNLLFSRVDFKDINLFVPRDERYDTEDLTLIPDVKYVTNVVRLLKVDFGNVESLVDLQQNVMDLCYTFHVSEKCKIDAYAMWFDLHLTEDLTITSDPRNMDRCNAWDVAIYPRASAAKFEAGNSFKLLLRWLNGFIPLGITTEKKCEDSIPVEKEVIYFLNDAEYINSMIDAFITSCNQLDEIFHPFHKMSIYDYSSFLIIGFLLLKKGAGRLTCRPKMEPLMRKLAEYNGINMDKISCVCKSAIPSGQKFEMMIHDVIETIGTLKAGVISRIMDMDMIRPEGIVVPKKLTMVAKLVASQYLKDFNRVFDRNLTDSEDGTTGYEISAHINSFQVTQNTFHPFLEFEKTYISDEFVIYENCYTKRTSDIVRVEVIGDGFIDAVQTYYDIYCTPDFKPCSTNNKNSHVNSIYHLIDPPLRVKRGETVALLVFCEGGDQIKIVIDTDN